MSIGFLGRPTGLFAGGVGDARDSSYTLQIYIIAMTQSSATETHTSNNNNEIGFKNGTEIDAKPKPEYKLELVWRNVILMIIVHLSGLYGLYLGMFFAQPTTVYFMFFVALLSSFGIQCGAHRLWCHRTYKAKLPLQILLAFMHILALENDIYEW
ncbi:unnamed protein product, partial [Oppiella nova]